MTGLRTARLTDANPHRAPIRTTSAVASKLVFGQRQTSTAFRANAVQDCRSQPFVRKIWALHPQKRILRKRAVVHAVVLLLFKNCIRCRTMIWNARCVPFESRISSKSGILFQHHGSAPSLKLSKEFSRGPGSTQLKARCAKALTFGGHECQSSDTNCKRRRFGL